MRLSGPIRADLVSFCGKRIMLLSDCHMPGKGCDDESNLASELTTFMEMNGKDFLLLIEGSQDIESSRTDLDLVKFSHDVNMRKVPDNVTVYHTDVRRYSSYDDFWLEDFIRAYSDEVRGCHHIDEFLELLSTSSESKNIDKVCLMISNISHLLLSHEDMYTFIDDRYLQTRDSPLQLSSWLMDCYTLSLIYDFNISRVIYYCGELHTNNLINFFRSYEQADVKSYRSKFLDYCDRNGCQEPGYHLNYSLAQSNSRCLNLDVDLNSFFN